MSINQPINQSISGVLIFRLTKTQSNLQVSVCINYGMRMNKNTHPFRHVTSRRYLRYHFRYGVCANAYLLVVQILVPLLFDRIPQPLLHASDDRVVINSAPNDRIANEDRI